MVKYMTFNYMTFIYSQSSMVKFVLKPNGSSCWSLPWFELREAARSVVCMNRSSHLEVMSPRGWVMLPKILIMLPKILVTLLKILVIFPKILFMSPKILVMLPKILVMSPKIKSQVTWRNKYLKVQTYRL